MKNLISVFAILMLSFSAYTQGIKFEHGDWASVKAKAQQENKIIFIDFYTSWCGPCKQMAKNIFPLENVGDFYNKNFVCYKLDAEKGEGVALAKKYGVKSYPTYIFTDSKGEFLHQGNGSMPAGNFINFGKEALDPEKHLANLIGGKKEISKEDMPRHLQELFDKKLPYDEKFQAYITSLSQEELITQQSFDLLLKFGGSAANGFAYETVVNNKTAFEEKLGKQMIENYFYRRMLSRVYEYKGRKESYAPVFEEARGLGYELEDKIEQTLVIYGYLKNNPHDFEGFVTKCKAFLKAYEYEDPALKEYPVFTMCSGRLFRNEVLDAYVFQLASELEASKSEYLPRAYGTIAQHYNKANLLEKGLEYYNKALASAKELGQNAEMLGKAVEYVKTRIQIIEKGNYTFNGKGFERYNGLAVNLWYYSPTKIGKIVETEKVAIKDGEFSLSGNTQTPLMGGFEIYDGKKKLLQGDMIIEAGTYPLTLGENGSFEVEQSFYNWTVYNGWKTFYAYKDILKKMWALEDKGNVDEAAKQQIEAYKQQLEVMKAEYISAIYKKSADPVAKALLALEGKLYVNKSKQNTSGDKVINELKNLIPNHYLIKTMQKKQ
ncbi:thioredoxin family protein [Marinifilum flexuosum]|uniref:Thioredoxin-related protein n=1 Tax=Marinifilum flexuosum TaxID=1117708 RepID=A0A419WWA7_9BACT|nr:thioredoxin family protein [Marinifilum flexuosum]RKD99774.1 thioredoxin-related protein [Marinifilum flexuosum]